MTTLSESVGPTTAARLEQRRRHALTGAQAAIEALSKRGVQARLIGSLTQEDRFTQLSDVDLLITECPKSLKYAIESLIEDHLIGLTFDVLYLDELSPERASQLLGRSHA